MEPRALNNESSSLDYVRSTEVMAELGLNPRNWTDQVVVAEALRRGLRIAKTPKSYIELRDDHGKRSLWKSGYSSSNTILAQRVAQHKDVCSRLLLAYDLPGSENAVFERGEASRAWLWAEKLGSVVLKPSDGIHGRDVHVDISSLSDFLTAFDAILSSGWNRVLVEKFYRGTEHRCLVVNGALVAVTRRRAASVVGDGVSSVETLVNAKNDRGRRYPDSRVHSLIQMDDEAKRTLSRSGFTISSVPEYSERVYLRATSNIHAGGDAIDATDELSAGERSEVERAARAISGGRVLGLDVLLPRSDGDDPMRIIEVNTNSMISIHHFPWEGEPRDVAASVLDALFPGTSR